MPNKTQNANGNSGWRVPDELAPSLSRDFLLFDVLPVALVATAVSVALAGTNGGSSTWAEKRVVESALLATPSSLLVWWFSIVGVAALARPVLRFLVAAARWDGSVTRKESAEGHGPLGKAIQNHAVAMGDAYANAALFPSYTCYKVSELKVREPAAYKNLMEHRERWEVSLRLAIAVVIAGVACGFILQDHDVAAAVAFGLGIVAGPLLYWQAAGDYELFSKVAVGALTSGPHPALEVINEGH